MSRLIDVEKLLKERCIALDEWARETMDVYKNCDECLKDKGYCGLEIKGEDIWRFANVNEEGGEWIYKYPWKDKGNIFNAPKCSKCGGEGLAQLCFLSVLRVSDEGGGGNEWMTH